MGRGHRPDRRRQVHPGAGRGRLPAPRRAGSGQRTRGRSAPSTCSRHGLRTSPGNAGSSSRPQRTSCRARRPPSARSSRSAWRTSASNARRWTTASSRRWTRSASGISPNAIRGRCRAASSSESPSPRSPRWARSTLVLDEPTAELDPGGTEAVVELLGRLRARRHDDPLHRARTNRAGRRRPRRDPRRRADRGRAARPRPR